MGVRATLARGLQKAIGDENLQRLRRTEARARRGLIDLLDVEARTKRREAEVRAAGAPSAQQKRAALIDALGRRSLDDAVNQEGLKWATNDPFAEHPPTTLSRHDVLAGLHRLLAPRTYFEIGVRWGDSLELSRTRSIGVDPVFNIKRPLHCDLLTVQATSDDFFERPVAFDHFEGRPIDLAFIDGMHLADFALRDFVNVERHCTPGSVVVFDDVLPRNHLEAYRVRRTMSWAGDVYKVHDVLRRLRPDLVVVPLNTTPTGTMLVANLDPTSTVLADALPAVIDDLITDDPQTVPDELLLRSVAADAAVVLASDVWPRVVAARDAGRTDELVALWHELDGVPRLG